MDNGQLMGAPLRWLNQFASSELAARLKLHEPAQRWLYKGTKAGFRAASAAAKRFGPKKPVLTEAERMAAPPNPNAFDISLSDEQEMIRDTLRKFADAAMRPVARAADEACAPPRDLLQQCHDLGVSLLAVPEALGGAGEQRSPVSNALIAEDLARGDLGLAYAAMSPLAVINALVDWGTAAQQARYLAPFASEDWVPAALAMAEPHPLSDVHALRTEASADPNGGYIVHGQKSLVPLGQSAELFLVAADLAGVGPRLFFVERDAPGLTVEPTPSMGLRSADLCRLRLERVRVDEDAMLGEPGRDSFDYGAVVDRARIAWSAMAVGACQAVLDYVVPYCNERIAFGEPISNRQSVAFLIADIAVELDGMRMLVYRAAGLAEQGKPCSRAAYLARVQCADKAMKIGTDGVQLLGGHGFITDHPVEMWYRHLRAIGAVEGGVLA